MNIQKERKRKVINGIKRETKRNLHRDKEKKK
jgi:hypothetical protein